MVSREEAQKKAKEYGCLYFETSAKSKVNVEEAFVAVVRIARDTKGKGEAVVVEKKKSRCFIL